MRARFASVLSAVILTSCANPPADVPHVAASDHAERREFTGSTPAMPGGIEPAALAMAPAPAIVTLGEPQKFQTVGLASMPYPSADATTPSFDFSEGIVKNADGTFSLAPPAIIPIIDVTATNVALMTGRYDKHIQAMDVDVPW